ncbi:cation:proton antiporter [Rhizobium sp. FKL33]|uniref:cation:proton antiporter n=1 Tax=Rhizobium sp. FKL33 TaxID=2562307 RepID=UPI0010C03DEA|nr:cation:proton antiporter [Rhizobium sp. FKL33]
MTPADILIYSVHFGLATLIAAMALIAFRVLRGPTLADRALALDQLVGVAIGFIAVIAVKTGYELYIDIALALGLTGFLTTAAFARYLALAGDPEGLRGDTASDKTEKKTAP